uniref:Uncharacterized AAA domain-containing protein ycf46 n=1 Tax=Gelidium elegans TaxID=37200 RepID=A0A141SDK1_GELEL|nr:hypothetical protein Gele_118 [Gelidium elegans]AMK96369.1 hypothetical protein Gele_118 [Gelidium elegans]
MLFQEKLKLLLASQYVCLYVVTEEEERFINTIQSILKTQDTNISIYFWDFIEGYNNNPNYISQESRNPLGALEFIEKQSNKNIKLFILKDYHVFLNDISVIRKIKNLVQYLRESNSYIIILASEIQVPRLLQEVISIIQFPLPNYKEIRLELQRLFDILHIDSTSYIDSLCLACQGFSIDRIRKSISKFIFSNKSLGSIISILTEEKKELIRQTDVLDLYTIKDQWEDIGGLDNLKLWLSKRAFSFSTQAFNYGLPAPKGVLLVGVQGTGKSLSAKTISKQWHLPLLKLDIGKVFASLVGESEERIRKVIHLAEQLEPCILWIDEIDKAFTKVSVNTDSGTTNRVLSSLLTWLSEKRTHVFVVATANNILSLPTELLRKGRFDEIFFLDLPTLKERYSIFKIHLKKVRPLTWRSYDIHSLSQNTSSFSGAEIKQLIIEAMYNAFYEKRDFTTEDIIYVIKESIPLAFTDQDTVLSLQNWAKTGKVKLAS